MNNAGNDSGKGIGGDPTREGNALSTLLIACVVTAALWFVPYAAFLTYPIRLLVTFLHEGGHALATLMTGGLVRGMAIFPDGSGVTYTQGGAEGAIIPAGYLGATLYGAGLIALLRGRAHGRALLLVTGLFIGILTLAFIRPWANLFGFGWGVGLTALLVAAGLRLGRRPADWAAAFLGIQCALNALFDLRTLLQLSWGLPVGHPVQTDAAQMARLIPLPAVVWAVLWIGVSVAMLWLVLRPRRSGSPNPSLS